MLLRSQGARPGEIVSADPNSDGILVIVSPQAMTDPTAIAKGLEPLKKIPGKPILASWMGAGAVAKGEAILNAAGIPTFQYPDTAVRAFCSMSRYNDNLCALYETPTLSVEGGCEDARAGRIIDAARRQNRTLLSESESKGILHAYGIPVAGVTVDAMKCQNGYELMVGSRIDPQFGPVLRFGLGGRLGKVMKDYALGLPPLNATLARRMMEQTRVYTALKGAEGRPAGELESLEALLIRFSLLVARQGIDVIFGHILPENYGMQRVCKNLGFTINYDRFEEVMKAGITFVKNQT